MTLDGDRPCWGESGLPLLPAVWRPWLPDHLIDTRQTNEKHGAIIELQFFCSATDWSKYFPRELGLNVAVEAFSKLLDDDPEPSFIDTPIVSGLWRDATTVADVPFLVETWTILESTFGNLASIAEALSCCTALDILQITGAPSVVLDLAITTPSWVDETAGGFLTVAAPAVPRDFAEAFKLAGLRHLRAACVKEKYLEPGSPWFAAISGRAGFTIDAQLTLDQAGQLVGVTRERVRQVVASFPLDHSIQRRWPLSSEMSAIRDLLEGAAGRRRSDLEQELRAGKHDPWHLTIEQADQLLGWFGHPVGLGVDMTGRIHPDSNRLGIPDDLTLDDIRRMVWEMSEQTGFLREPDLTAELRIRQPDLTHDQMAAILDAAVGHLRLPLDYLFFTTHKNPAVLGVFRRMLSWVNPLSAADLHEGLIRRFRFRKFPIPPPLEVIVALIERFDEFDVEGDMILCRSPEGRDTNTVLGWISAMLLASESGVLHRSTILEECRKADMNTTSVSVYLQFGETIRPVGRGCFALTGTSPTEAAITTAQKVALRSQVPNRVTTSYPTGGIRLSITVGNALRDSGVVSISVRVKRLIADRSLPITSHVGSHGNLGTSNSMLYGLSSAMNALEVMPGDAIIIDINLIENTAFLHLPDESDE